MRRVLKLGWKDSATSTCYESSRHFRQVFKPKRWILIARTHGRSPTLTIVYVGSANKRAKRVSNPKWTA